MERISSRLLSALVIAVIAVGACDAQNPSGAPNQTNASGQTAGATAIDAKPAIRIDPTWKASNGEWTFTGTVDPLGDSTDVVLEIGPGPSTARVFNQQIPVAQGLMVPTRLTAATRDIPDIPEICVRFSATNSSGTSVTSPLCFPHDLPSFVPEAGPPVTTFGAPAVGTSTVISVSNFSVSWTESDEGSTITARSLQRQVATDTGGVCGTFADDGAASTAISPVAATGLTGGHCYQWTQTLRNQAGVATVTTSGIVHVQRPT